MRRTDRLFEIIQILRRADAPVRAIDLADELGVSKRTVYRSIATLQSMRVPIEGEAGLGYAMRPGYDLPPVNLDEEEREAVAVGLGLIARTGDGGLARAAARVLRKLDGPRMAAGVVSAPRGLAISDWGIRNVPGGRLEALRGAVREGRAVTFDYHALDGERTRRTVEPDALTYYVEVAILTGNCRLRDAKRHFRVDRMDAVEIERDERGDAPALPAHVFECKAGE